MASALVVCLTATWVGGTFIIGTAETVYDPRMGLLWAVVPLAATLAFTLGEADVSDWLQLVGTACVLSLILSSISCVLASLFVQADFSWLSP